MRKVEKKKLVFGPIREVNEDFDPQVDLGKMMEKLVKSPKMQKAKKKEQKKE
jgi:hypothetical protein